MITRRTVLKLAALSSLGMLLPTTPAFASPAARTPGPPATRSRSKKSGPRPYPFIAPYKLTSQSQLSQDFFSTTEILLAESDEVLPFTGAGGAPSALVRSGDTVSLVAPDATQPSGYSYLPITLPQPRSPYSALPTAPATLRSLSVGDDAAGNAYVMLAWTPAAAISYPSGSLDTVFVWGRLSGDSITALGEIDTWSGAINYPAGLYPVPNIPPRAIFSASGSLRFALFLADDTYATVLPANGTIEYRTMPAATGIQDGHVCEMDGAYFTAAVDAQNDVICADQNGNPYVETGLGAATNLSGGASIVGFAPVVTNSETTGVGLGLVTYGPDAPNPNGPNGASIALFLLADGKSTYLPIQASYSSLSSVVVLPNKPSWQIASVAAGELQLALQLQAVGPYENPMSNAVPFQKGIERVWVAQTPHPSASTLFVERSDTSLAVLKQDPATKAWSLTPIRRAADTVQDLSMWRTHLVVQDSNGISVPNFAVTATATSEIAIWQNNSSRLIAPGSPATLMTNALGQIVFATPATALHTPSLTISGQGLPSTVISPDGEVHAYLAGTGSLSPAGSGSADGAFGAGTLANARVTDPDGSTRPLSPVLFGGATDDDSASAAVAKTINQAMVVGLAASARSTGTVAPKDLPDHFSLDFTQGAPKYSQLRGSRSAFSIEGIYDEISADAGDILDAGEAAFEQAKSALDNAVGTAINSCQKIGFTALTDASGATSYAIAITCIVADDVVTAINYVVSDVKTAIAAVTAVLKTIGAAIEDVIAWLRALLGGLIKDAWETAVMLDGYVDLLPGRLETILDATTSSVNADLTKFGKDVDSVFDELTTKIGDKTPAVIASGTIPSGPFVGQATDFISTVLSDCQMSWLLSKFLDAVPGVSFSFPAALGTQLAAAVTAVGTSATDAIVNIGQDWATTLTGLVGDDPTKIGQYALGAAIQTLKQVFDLGIALTDDVFDALIELFVTAIQSVHDNLNAPISSDLGFIGDILSLLGIDVTLTLQRLMCLVVAFPAVVIADLGAGSSVAQSLRGSSGEAAFSQTTGGPNPTADSILDFVYAFAGGLGAMSGVMDDGVKSTGEEPSQVGQLIGLATAMIQQAIAWPGADGLADPTLPDYQNGILRLDLPTSFADITWSLGLAPISIGLLDVYFSSLGTATDTDYQYFRDGAYFAAGSVLTVLSVLESVDQSGRSATPAADIALAATEWLPTALSILANKTIVENSDTISLLIKLALDAVLGGADTYLLFSKIS